MAVVAFIGGIGYCGGIYCDSSSPFFRGFVDLIIRLEFCFLVRSQNWFKFNGGFVEWWLVWVDSGDGGFEKMVVIMDSGG